MIGGLAGLAVIAGAIFWWRRRQNAAPAGEKHEGVQYDAAPAYSSGLSPHGAPAVGMAQQTSYYDAHDGGYGRAEVDGDATRNELPETTKYAHRTGEGEVHEAP